MAKAKTAPAPAGLSEKDLARIADRLGQLAELRKDVEAEEKELRMQFLDANKDSIRGAEFVVLAIPGNRTTLDRGALEEALGKDAVAPFLKTTSFVTVRTSRLQ